MNEDEQAELQSLLGELTRGPSLTDLTIRQTNALEQIAIELEQLRYELSRCVRAINRS